MINMNRHLLLQLPHWTSLATTSIDLWRLTDTCSVTREGSVSFANMFDPLRRSKIRVTNSVCDNHSI